MRHVRRTCLAGIVLCLCAAAAEQTGPAYTVDGILGAADYQPGPFAPNALVSIFGERLAWSARAVTPDDIRGGFLPVTLNHCQVFVANQPAPLFYVSENQINFLVPANLTPGPATIQVVREGVSGPEVKVQLADAAPALFNLDGFPIATHADNRLITAEDPARSGEIVVIYAAGLGKTRPNVAPGEIPYIAAWIAARDAVKVLLDGEEVTADRIKYAGVSPGSAGLYQINVQLPEESSQDPEIRVVISGQTSRPGLRLPLR